MRKNFFVVLSLAIIVLLLLGYLIFTFRTLLPGWQQRTELTAASATVEAANATRTAQQQDAAGQLGTEIEAARATLEGMANHFLTEAQAAAFLQGLYDTAADTAVTIVDLQAQVVAQSAAAAGEKQVYDVRQFQLLVEGDLVQLNEFVGRVEQTAVPGINLENLVITQGDTETADRLMLDLHLYTSPFATGESVADLPDPLATPEASQIPLPSPTPTISPTPDVSNLLAQLDDSWATENWPEVIGLVQEIRQLIPNDPAMTEKLYAARVNYGYQLADLGDTAAAAEQFEQALTIFPQGSEAEAALQSLFVPTVTPTPKVTIYVVKRGDTLFSIARRFGSTVEAVKAANNLMSNHITTGQQLTIP